jgi:uncharacterized protein YdeI (YjbR/CyaY-like superfamily)
MRVPYTEKWQKETDNLRKIAIDCDLTEALKWGKPRFTFQKKNVAIVIPLKESCAFSFKGAQLTDPKHILEGSEIILRPRDGLSSPRSEKLRPCGRP